MNKIDGIEMKKWIILILTAILTYWGLNNLEIIGGWLKIIFNGILPFILGGVIAFILNIPMSKIERMLLSKKKNKSNKGSIRVISIILSLMIFIGVILFVALLLIPELIQNITMLIESIPGLIDKLEVFVMDLVGKYPDIKESMEELFSGSGNVTDIVSNILNYLVNGAVGIITSLVSGFVTMFTAIIFAIYMLGQKEYLIKGSKKILYAFVKNKYADKVIEISGMINTTFSKFLSGQCLDACILGGIMFVALTIFRFPYALLISVLTAVTALVPIFGAIVAMIIGFVLIAITSPIKALIFIVVFQVVQQIEGNFIYPKVVGKSVGLSPMWTLLAITVGGNLCGVVGMLIGLPLASVIYALVKGIVNDKLKTKKIEL